MNDAERRSGIERERLLHMAHSFERAAIQIEQSARLIAESEAALAFADNVLAASPLRSTASLSGAEAADARLAPTEAMAGSMAERTQTA